jgi:2-dehydro-3-deoxyphosphogluconate aldolase/(4S)-4-hydroxy-2-oxoglutarate aldolase
MTHARSEICRRIAEVGIVPVVRVDSAELARVAVEALIAAGIPVVEITLTVPDANAVIEEISRRFEDRVLVGAGTVTSAAQARDAALAGAQFIVSPGLDADIIHAGHALGRPVIAGVLTPTEIMAATRAGADWLKIFPCAALGGASYLRALRGPFPELPLLPTGGVSLQTAADYLNAGAVALGVGSELVNGAELHAKGPAPLRERALAFAEIVRAVRSKAPPTDITPSAVIGADRQPPSRGQ